MKTQDEVNESLWELWNTPASESKSTPDSDERLKALHKAIGERENHRKWPEFIAFGTAAALAIACVCLSFSLHNFSEFRSSLTSQLVTVNAGLDGPTSLALPDGTSVILNARSTISYNMDFGETERCVKLEGEGFFDVAKDPNKTFTVTTDDMSITVHGTRFNVYAYPERKVDEVSLVEGSISITSGGNMFKMKPGDKILHDKISGSTHITRTDNKLETAWLGKELDFNHTPLSTVFDVLERRFGVTVKPVPGMDMSDCYTGSFTDRNLGDIMNILKMHYGFDWQLTNDTLILSNNNQ